MCLPFDIGTRPLWCLTKGRDAANGSKCILARDERIPPYCFVTIGVIHISKCAGMPRCKWRSPEIK